jgi:DNA-binding GntR family transcriptional regulator
MIQNKPRSPLSERPSNTNEWLVDVMREAIITGEFAEGEPIRQEIFAERYQVSRMPIREALRTLHAEGWVQLVPNKGAYVVPLDAADAIELFEMRAALEVIAARHSIPKLSDEQKKWVAQAHHRLATSLKAEYLSTHKDFHCALYAACTPRLQRLISQLIDATERYLRFEKKLLAVSREDRLEHDALLQAALEGNTKIVEQLLNVHIAEAGEAISQRLSIRTTQIGITK